MSGDYVLNKMFYVFKKLIMIILFVILVINISIFCFIPTKSFNKAHVITYLDNKGEIIYETINNKSGEYIELDEVSKHFINALVFWEDKRFYRHNGIDFKRIIKSAFSNIREGEISQGGSTITQQFVKNTFYSNEQTYKRKIKEIITSLKIEAKYNKSEILTAYINSLYFGHGIYGIENAAQYFFSKKALDLTLAESAVLIGIINAPAIYSPKINYAKSIEKQVQILNYLHNNHFITNSEFNYAINEKIILTFKETKDSNSWNYYMDSVNQELERLGFLNYNLGLTIETYYDQYINHIIDQQIGLLSLDSNTNLALMILQPSTNKVLACIGGKNYQESSYNRAISSYRQVGSTIKPIIYYLCLNNGLTPLTLLTSEPSNFYIRDFGKYCPSNYNDKYAYDKITMIEAVACSDNIYATKAGLLIGSKNIQTFLAKYDINVEPIPSLFLGSCEMNLLNMMSIYNTFASNGYFYKPSFIKKITDVHNRILYQSNNSYLFNLNFDTTTILNQMLKAPFDSNINTYASPSLINYQTKHPFSAKTGTVNNTSWVLGYNPTYTIGVWVGSEDGEYFNQGSLSKILFQKVANSITEGLPIRWYSPTNRMDAKKIDPHTGLSSSNGSVYYLMKE